MEGNKDFVFNLSIPGYKTNKLHQKTEDKQVQALKEKKNAFSADRLLCALGFSFLGSRATSQSQVMQIEKEKKGNDEVVEKKANKLCLMVEKANDAFQVYKSGGKMKKELYYDIMKSLVPLYNPKAASSKLNGLKKEMSKLDWFKEDYMSKQDVLMEIKLIE